MEILDEAPETELKPNEGKNKLLTFLNLGLFVVCIGILGISMIMGFDKYNDYAIKGIGLYFLTGIYLLVNNGSFIKSSLFRFTYLFIGIAIVGVLFKIMHWPGSSILLLLSFPGLIGTYGIYFITKQNKHWTDFVKLGLVFAVVSERLCTIFRVFEYSELLQIFSVLVLTLLLVESVLKFNRD